MNLLAQLPSRLAGTLYPGSWVEVDGAALGLARLQAAKRLVVLAPPGHPWLALFSGEAEPAPAGLALCLGPTDERNAQALKQALPNLQPSLLGLATSAGCGDRLGLATPGHVRAFEAVARRPGARPVLPLFGQQSIREMTRTQRRPADVMCDATWGAFEGGWRGVLGADADHLKTPADIDICAPMGFSFYTFDPGAYVDGEADSAAPAVLRDKVAALPWAELEDTQPSWLTRYAGRVFELEDRAVTLEGAALWRAAAKYGNAIAHVASMYRHLAAKGIPFELEVSVDETETPTSHAEHVYIAAELQRLGVRWVSLAPRYVGRFEKGVDYLGDLAILAADLAGHAAIARVFGPYKLSLHSGSDKFSVYPLIVAATDGLVHLKTAGTSYLEALRAIARVQPPLFRTILALAVERYPVDRATYHVSAELSRVPAVAALADADLPGLLDQFDAREVLHVTFGSALAQYGAEIRATLQAHEGVYYAALEAHFVRHLGPFAAAAQARHS